MDYIYTIDDNHDYLYHHGIKGQKWGVRRYQNSDGSLTPEGYQRYSKRNGRGLSLRSRMSENMADRAQKVETLEPHLEQPMADLLESQQR